MSPLKRYLARRNAVCSVSACGRTTDGISKLCNRHKRLCLRNGAPTANSIRKSEVRHARKEVQAFLKANAGHPTLTKTFGYINEVLDHYAVRGEPYVTRNIKPATYSHRLACELYRLKTSGCTAAEVFEEVATLFLFTLRDPRRLQRHTREHHFQTARMVLNLRPRFSKSFISGNTGRKYSTANRLSSEVLDKFGTFLNVQLIGSLCAMTESIEFNRKREERFKRELASTLAAHPFSAAEPAHA
jgi:hypothetical protein